LNLNNEQLLNNWARKKLVEAKRALAVWNDVTGTPLAEIGELELRAVNAKLSTMTGYARILRILNDLRRASGLPSVEILAVPAKPKQLILTSDQFERALREIENERVVRLMRLIWEFGALTPALGPHTFKDRSHACAAMRREGEKIGIELNTRHIVALRRYCDAHPSYRRPKVD
jgi:hypothetical protein